MGQRGQLGVDHGKQQGISGIGSARSAGQLKSGHLLYSVVRHGEQNLSV